MSSVKTIQILSPTLSNFPMRKDGVLLKPDVFEEFVIWFALPREEKKEMGITTQAQFATKHGLSQDTPTDWKKRRDFMVRIKELRDSWAKERTQDVIGALYKGATSQNNTSPQDRKLWMQVVEGWNEKAEIDLTVKSQINQNDIRYVIEQLPEPQRSTAYEHLRAIIDLADSLRDSGQLEDRTADIVSIDGVVQGQADQHAQGVSDERSYALAPSDPGSVCSYMEREVPTYHHQSAARWWEVETDGHRRLRPLVS